MLRTLRVLDGLFVGGTWDTNSSAGRWASYWYTIPETAWQNIGLRCAVPLSLARRPESSASNTEECALRETGLRFFCRVESTTDEDEF